MATPSPIIENAAAIYDRYDNEDIPEDDRQRQLLALEALAAYRDDSRQSRGCRKRLPSTVARRSGARGKRPGQSRLAATSLPSDTSRPATCRLRKATLPAPSPLTGKLSPIAQQRLVAADPANEKWQRDLSVGQSKIGNMLRDRKATCRARLRPTRRASTYWQNSPTRRPTTSNGRATSRLRWTGSAKC